MSTSPLYPKLSFFEKKPWLQHAWDSSTLSTFLRCPRRYFYQYVVGFQPRAESVDLTFGTLIHVAMEEYHMEKLSRGHTEAQIRGLQALLKKAWVVSSHEAQVAALDQGVELTGFYWKSSSNNKNLWNALRAFIWHTEQFGLEPDFNTALIGGKTYALELPFSFQLATYGPTTEGGSLSLTYCGHLDRMADTASNRWVIDYKTTKKTINSDFFNSYELSTQLPGYGVAAKIVFHEPVRGVIVDGFQIGVDFVRCARGHITLGEEKADEWLKNTTSWIMSAVEMADLADIKPAETLIEFATLNAHNWPMNTESCFICPFKEVCRSTPSIRGAILEADFKKKVWDPLDRNKDKDA